VVKIGQNVDFLLKLFQFILVHRVVLDDLDSELLSAQLAFAQSNLTGGSAVQGALQHTTPVNREIRMGDALRPQFTTVSEQ